MATLILIGPKTLDAATIDNIKCTRGIYVLTDKEKNVKRIGKCEEDFVDHLRTYLGNKSFPGLTMFWYQRASTKRELFELACLAYHKWSPPMNEAHPERHEGSTFACPEPACTVLDS